MKIKDDSIVRKILLLPWRYFVVTAVSYTAVWAILLKDVGFSILDLLIFVMISFLITHLVFITIWAATGGYSYAGSMTETDQETGEKVTVKFGEQFALEKDETAEKFSTLKLSVIFQATFFYTLLSGLGMPIALIIFDVFIN